jgi:hypothetical protein
MKNTYSQHQEVARVAPEGISEIYCCAGDPGDIDIEALWKDTSCCP